MSASSDQTAARAASGARLQVHGLTVDYGEVRAVDAVDFTVGGPGRQVVALLGPSGCGKSTLLRALAGIEQPRSGRVLFDGADVSDAPAHRRGFGLLFQDGQLFPHRTVAGNIGYGLRGPWGRGRGTRAGRARRIEELLGLVGLEGMGGRRVGELSGGQAQRVALARALAPRPRMLLLDEPLSALDRELRDRLAVDIARILRTTGTPAVVVTHDHGEAAALADRIAVMRAGRLVQEAEPRHLWRHPRDDATARFLGYPVVLDGHVTDGTAECALGRVPVAHPDGPVRLGLRAESLRAVPAGVDGTALGVESTAPGVDSTALGVDGTVESVTVLPSRTLVSVLPDGAGHAAPVVATWGGPSAGASGDCNAAGACGPAPAVGPGPAPAVGDRVRLSPVPGMVAVIAEGSVREVAAGAVVRDGAVLLAQRSRPPALDGLWELPGGKVEPGESGPQGLRRELHEELGITVRVGRRLPGEARLDGADATAPMLLRAYLAEVESGEPEAREHRALHWADGADLQRMPLVDNDRVWIEALQAVLKDAARP